MASDLLQTRIFTACNAEGLEQCQYFSSARQAGTRLQEFWQRGIPSDATTTANSYNTDTQGSGFNPRPSEREPS